MSAKRISITLDAHVEQEIRRLSVETCRSFSRYINLVLKKHIEAVRKSVE